MYYITVSVTPFLRKSAVGAATGTLYIRATDNLLHCYFNTGESIPSQCFNYKKKIVINYPLAESLNLLIESEKNVLHRKII